MKTIKKRVSVCLYLELNLSDEKIVERYMERDGMEISGDDNELTPTEEELVFAEIDKWRKCVVGE